MHDKVFVARQLKRLGKLLEIKGENSFKTQAYSKGARVVEAIEEPLEDLIANDKLGEIPGIGAALQQKIIDLVRTGTTKALARVEEEIPEGVADMLKIKGLGPKKIQVIWHQMGITTIGELYYACNENRLVEAKGFGAKTQDKIKKAIEFLQANAEKFHYATLVPYADSVVQELKKKLKVEVELCGEIRRKMPVLAGIHILVAAEAEAVLTAAEKIKQLSVPDTESAGTEHAEASQKGLLSFEITDTNIPVSVHLAKGNFPAALVRETGNAAHLAGLQIDASAGYGSEAAVYEANGLQYVAPELREGKGELELAAQHALPTLVAFEDFRGMVHNHSTWSDGLHTLEQMAVACRDMGLEYLGISDHSKSAFYANGLNEERILAQHAEIDALNQKLAPFRIFKGIESDILNDGSLDYAPEVLASFDFIVASVHSQLSMSEEKATDRLLKAIENPYTTMLGHPTGRLLLVREGYPIDHKRIIDACAKHEVMIEINANPYRLDLDWTWVRYALDQGVMLSINPDAHKMEGYQDAHWGLAAARKGMLTADRCLNCLPLAEVEAIFTAKKAAAR